ncbi:MFS general substrate transporter [Irpex rosettiformis]|uniref:MFS general substrate transporter n=1 Tax=Irpex rosettiformis TaxID=378272 RepID=A0ACB8U3C8_9APHY|nr:MFS general substrate transporter [Irpex rosettiformis]
MSTSKLTTESDEVTPLLRDETNSYQTNAGDHNAAGAHDTEGVEITKPKVSRAAVLVPMSIGIFLAAMDGTIIASSYATIGSELQQLHNTSWIATGYMLTLTSFQPLYGKLSDIFGRRACLILAYTIFALGCLFCGLARNMTELVAARALAGIGGGGMTTVASIVMSDVAPLRERGTWQGIANTVFATGQAVGAPLGGYLADTIGWRWSFILQVPLAILAIVAVSIALKLPKIDSQDFLAKLKRIDFGGALTLVAAVFCLLLGLDRGGNVSWQDHYTVGYLVAFGVLFLIFTFIELEIAAEPFAPKRIIVNCALFASYSANFFAAGMGVVQAFMITLYFQAIQGMTAGQAGVVLIPSILAAVLGSLLSGVIMQATGKYYWLTVGVFVMMLIGHIVVPIFSGLLLYSYVGITVGLCLGAFGIGAAITTTLISLIANAGPVDQAIATAVSYLFRSLGTVVWLSVGTTLMQDTLRHLLYERLTGEDVDEIIKRVRQSLSYIGELEPPVRVKVIASYEDALHATMYFTASLTVFALVSSLFIKEKSLAN